MEMFAFGGPLAWLAFLLALLLVPPLVLAAHVRAANLLVRPLAIVGVAAAGYTLANALAYLRDWDFWRSSAEVLSFDPAGSKGELAATLLIPVWPYAATAFGMVLVIAYSVIACRPRLLIARLASDRRPPSGPGRLARERARVAHFDE
jgi:hypothetical protein